MKPLVIITQNSPVINSLPVPPSPSSIIPIKQSNIPFVISTPGIYSLEEDIIYSGTLPAITISSNNVRLDLGNHNINLGGVSRQAISANGVSNIEIINGWIRNGNLNFTTDDIISIPPFVPLTNIPLIPTAAIRMSNVNNIIIENINIDAVLYGIVITQATRNIQINNCTIVDFGVMVSLTNSIGYGILVTGTNNTTRANTVSVTNSIVTSSSGNSGIGVIFVDNFEFDNNTVSSAYVQGEPVNLGAYVVVDSSSGSISNSILRESVQPFFSLRSSSLDLNNLKVQRTPSDGIQMVFTNYSVIRNCTVLREGITNLPNLNGSGIKLIVCTGISVKNNTSAFFNLGPGQGTSRDGIGIVLSACSGCDVQECTTYSNVVGIRQQLQIVIGPNIFIGTQSTFVKNVSHDNLLNNYLDINSPITNLNDPQNTPTLPFTNIQYPSLPTTTV